MDKYNSSETLSLFVRVSPFLVVLLEIIYPNIIITKLKN
jgi:hypothetical protein